MERLKKLVKRTLQPGNLYAVSIYLTLIVLGCEIYALGGNAPTDDMAIHGRRILMSFVFALDIISVLVYCVATLLKWKSEGMTLTLRLDPEDGEDS